MAADPSSFAYPYDLDSEEDYGSDENDWVDEDNVQSMSSRMSAMRIHPNRRTIRSTPPPGYPGSTSKLPSYAESQGNMCIVSGWRSLSKALHRMTIFAGVWRPCSQRAAQWQVVSNLWFDLCFKAQGHDSEEHAGSQNPQWLFTATSGIPVSTSDSQTFVCGECRLLSLS